MEQREESRIVFGLSRVATEEGNRPRAKGFGGRVEAFLMKALGFAACYRRDARRLDGWGILRLALEKHRDAYLFLCYAPYFFHVFAISSAKIIKFC